MRHVNIGALVCASVGVAALACATSPNSASMGGALYIPRPSTVAGVPSPTSLGQRDVGAVSRKNAALSVADSVVRAMGWTVMSINAPRSELRTDWLYIQGPTFNPANGRLCGNMSPSLVGLRLIVGPRNGSDSMHFGLHGELRYVNGVDPAESERVGRDAFDVATAALRAALPLANERPDTLTAGVGTATAPCGSG